MFAPPPGAPPAGIFGGTVGNGAFTATFVDPGDRPVRDERRPYGDPNTNGTFGGTYGPGQYDVTLNDVNSGVSTLTTQRNPDRSVNFVLRRTNAATIAGTIPDAQAPPGLPFSRSYSPRSARSFR